MNYEALDEALDYIEAVSEGASWNIDSDDKYVSGIKKNKSKIEAVVNKISRDLFKNYEKESNWAKKYKEDFEKFIKGKAPVVSGFYKESDYVEMRLKFTSGSEDSKLFYQDDLVKKLNASVELKNLGYRFSSEDNLAILIKLSK